MLNSRTPFAGEKIFQAIGCTRADGSGRRGAWFPPGVWTFQTLAERCRFLIWNLYKAEKQALR